MIFAVEERKRNYLYIVLLVGLAVAWTVAEGKSTPIPQAGGTQFLLPECPDRGMDSPI